MNDNVIQPACAGMYELFDSINRADHERAAEFCAVCPMRAECKNILLTAQREKPMPGAKYGPAGTWAGMLLAPKNATPA